MKCQLCGSEELFLVLDLGDQPVCNNLVAASDLKDEELVYPLQLFVCQDCWLVQIAPYAPAKIVFGPNYNYLTGSSVGLNEYFGKLAQQITNSQNLAEDDLIVDIGGNDGTFLKNFLYQNKVLNIEPTPQPANIARSKGISTTERFFTKEIAKEIGKAKVVTAFNVLAHCADVHDFLEGIRELMNEDSVFISQSHYLPALIEQLEYDTIYHEHLRYYTMTSLNELFYQHGLYVWYAEINDIYGGSIITYARLKTPDDNYPVVHIIDSEEKYRRLDTYIEFANQVNKNREKLLSYLHNLKARGKHIIGIGAPMKASTLLNYCGIGTETLDYLTEVNPLKIGYYSPGTHIPIVDEKVMLTNPPDYALVLSWNFADEIVHKLRSIGYKGAFINPIPTFHVVNEVVSFEDERGKIVDILTDEQIEHVNYITFKAGAVRGNHFHKQSIHFHYVLKGQIEFYRKLSYGPIRKEIAKVGDLVFTGFNESHALRALEDSEIMVFTRGPRGGRNYETDTYRLEEGDKLC